MDPKSFFDAADAMAVVVKADDLFGLLTRTYDLPNDVAALVTREHGDRVVMQPGTQIAADDVVEVMLVRTAPFILSYSDLQATSVDKYHCAAGVTLRLSVVLESSELVSFQNAVVGSGRVVRVSAVEAFFASQMTRAVALAAEGRGVEVLIDPAASETVSAEIGACLKKSAFAAGVKIQEPPDVRFDSAVYRQVRQSRCNAERRQEEFDAKRRIEQARAAAHAKHVERLSTLLDDLRGMSEKSPGVELPDLIKTFSDADRAELYEALIGADDGHGETEFVVAGSGAELLLFAPKSLDAPQRTVAVSGDVGPVRSVRLCVDCDGERRLLVGASYGLYELAANGDERVTTYAADPDGRVKGGVNSVALAGDRVFATHSELGLLCWDRGCETPVRNLLVDQTRQGTAVRCVQFFGGDLYFSIDCDVYKLPADALEQTPHVFRGSGSLITAVCATAGGVYAGNGGGQILHWQGDHVDAPEVLHAGRERSAESVVLLDVGGLVRLFYADTSLAVFARVVGDTFTCRYEAGGQTLRRVEVAPDVIVATNEVRDRLILWHPGRPAEPYGVAPVARLTGHSVQDVCLIPRA